MSAVGQVMEVLQPKRLVRDLFAGSGVLLRLMLRGLMSAARSAAKASGGAEAAAPTPTGKAATVEKADGGEGQEQGEPADAEPGRQPARVKKAPPKAVAAAKTGSDRMEQAAMLLLVGLVTVGGLVAVGGAVLAVLRPYRTVIVSVLVVGWFVAALVAAPQPAEPEDDQGTPGETPDDQETVAGEEHAEEEPEEDPWPVQRESIRKWVEELAAAGAAGRRDAKGKGVPVDDLFAEMHDRGVPGSFDRKDMIELLERAGITVRDQMKFRIGGRQKTPPGVHVDDLAKDLGHRPRLPAHLVPDLTLQSGRPREAESAG
ncbi:hypothetical protein AB0N14_17680 [Streptomyces sp. NPDC051104]|uniref:hypothetical protein n=1 Tax=Streptomyces sp. NPDC051104 TaxID=3155044 RepID=UPI0034143DE0